MKNNKIKLIIYKILFVILIITAIVIIGIIANKQYNDKVYDEKNLDIVKLFHEEEEEKETIAKEEGTTDDNIKINLELEGHKVIGLIKIPAIDLEYPILEKTTQATMKIAISRFFGGDINEYGNVSLAGHNNYSGTMFGKNKYLKLGDKIYLTDLTTKTIEYEIYDIFTTDPNDTSILETKDETVREVTLITCKNGRSQRLIIKAKEKV